MILSFVTLSAGMFNPANVMKNKSQNMGRFFSNKQESKVLEPEDDKIYFAAFPDFGGEENTVTDERIDEFESLSEKGIAWASFSQHWFQGITYPKDKIHTINDKGIIPYVRFMPRSSLDESQKEEKFTLEHIIDGEFDTELREWAKDAKADDIPIIIDFAVEMNGDWFKWSGIFNGAGTKDAYGNPNLYDGPERYRDAYRHIIDIFKKENVHNITWFFHPSIMSTPSEEWNAPKYYYPGDEYIDWIGISIYGALNPKTDSWNSFEDILSSGYKQILEISDNKPLAILELGVTDNHPLGKKSKWIKDAFDTILSKKYLDFKAVTYWHENWDDNGVLSSLRIDSSSESLQAFKDAVKNDKFTSTPNIQ